MIQCGLSGNANDLAALAIKTSAVEYETNLIMASYPEIFATDGCFA